MKYIPTRLAIADYNDLENTPIVSANIYAITPKVNTYYKHIDGVIYFYNGTEFVAVGGSSLPKVTTADYGKILMVNNNGEWEATDLPSAEEEGF